MLDKFSKRDKFLLRDKRIAQFGMKVKLKMSKKFIAVLVVLLVFVSSFGSFANLVLKSEQAEE